MPVILERAFSSTKREHSIGNLTTALLLDDIGMVFYCLLGWLLKWSCSNQNAMLVPLLVPLLLLLSICHNNIQAENLVRCAARRTVEAKEVCSVRVAAYRYVIPKIQPQ
jgi:hypothetical protein